MPTCIGRHAFLDRRKNLAIRPADSRPGPAARPRGGSRQRHDCTFSRVTLKNHLAVRSASVASEGWTTMKAIFCEPIGRPEGQGASHWRHGRFHARHNGHAVVRGIARSHPGEDPPFGRHVQHGRGCRGELLARSRTAALLSDRAPAAIPVALAAMLTASDRSQPICFCLHCRRFAMVCSAPVALVPLSLPVLMICFDLAS